MELFARFRRTASAPDASTQPPAVVPHLLPAVNQRLTVWVADHAPVPSRVEDEHGGDIVIASPNLAIGTGDPVTISWEGEAGWFSLDTQVTSVDEHGAVPTVSVAASGRLTRHDERRGDLRVPAAMPLELRVVMARVVKGGRTLKTHTAEIGSNALRFSTSAPFAPGDTMECRLSLADGEPIHARLKVIRMDSVSGSWRQTCTAAYDDILRSDRSRIVAFLEAQQRVTGGGGTTPFADRTPHQPD